MHDAGLVGTELRLAGLGAFDGLGYVRRHGADLRIRHQTARAENLAKLAHDLHGLGGRDGEIEFDLARLDLIGQVLEADDVGAGLFRGLGGVAFGEHRDAHLFAGAARHHRRAAHVLVRLLGVDAEVDGDVHRFVELGAGGALENLQSLVERIILHAIDFGELGFHAFAGHITPPRIPRPSGVRCPR